MSEAVVEGGEQWTGHRVAAALVRLVVWLAPIAITVITTHLLSDALPRPSGWFETAVWWVVLSGLATGVLFISDRLARRLLPLAALLKLSLVFPDRAPSRYKSALRTGTVHQLKQRVLDIKQNGLPDDPALAAEALIELVAALSAHDRLTRGHAERVRAYSRMIGEELKLSDADLDRLQWAGMLHDVGKLFVPGEILNKHGVLTEEEFEIIKQHPGWGAQMCEPLRGWLGDWVDAVGEHHERWDGRGYPSGIANDDISLAARIVAVADVYDVITSVRSYKHAESAVDGRSELARCAGTQFDPRIVRVFLNISLGRLRLVMGPLSWLSQVPMIGRVPVGATAGAAVSAAAAAVTLVAGGLLDRPDDRATVVEAAEVVVTTSSPSTPTTPTTTTPTTPTPPIDTAVVITQPTTAPPATVAEPTTTISTTTTQPATTTTPPAPPNTTTVPATTVPQTSPPGTTPPTTTPTSTTTSTTTVPAPPALVAADDQMVTSEDSPATFDVGANDHNWVGPASVAQPAQGHVVAAGPGRFTYLPAPDWFGVETFTYTVNASTVNGSTVNGSGGATATATVTVTVEPVADDPEPAGDVATVDEDQTIAIAVLDNDAERDGEPLTVTAVASSTGLVATDGITVTYTPPPDANGSHLLTYTATDSSGATADATATITVNPVADPPLAGDDMAAGDEDQSISFVVLGNDTDPDGESLVVTAATSSDGTASTDGTTIFYTPDADVNGTHTVEYIVTDSSGATDLAVVTVTVAPVPDSPVASDDAQTVGEDTSIVVAVLGNDTDADGEPLTIVGVTADSGVATTDGATISYTPPSDASGTYTISYTVDDGTGATATAVVTVTVSPVADPPVAADDAYTVFVDQPLNVAPAGVLGNDSDEDGDPLTAALVSGPTSGTLTLDPDGSFDYTPASGFVGTATFVYAALDGSGSDDLATVTIEISNTTVPVAFYLGTSGTNADNWSLQVSPSPVANPEPDHDGDGNPGLAIDDSSMSLGDTDGDDYQHWNMVVGAPLILSGPASLDLWSTTQGFDTNDDLDYTIWLMDCAADGTGCTTIAFVDDVHVDDWNAGTPNFVRRTLGIGAINHTIATGRMLRLRLMFHHHDAWVALSGSRASQLIVTQPA